MTKHPSTESNTRPLRTKNANPDPFNICAAHRTYRSRTKTAMGRSRGNTQQDMQKTHDHMVRRCKRTTGKRKEEEKTKTPQEYTISNKIGPYARANTEKGNGTLLAKIRQNEADDANGNMELAEKRKQDTWKTQTARKYD